jgi:hypothetical protein
MSPPLFRRGGILSVCLSVCPLLDDMVSADILKTICQKVFKFHIVIGLGVTRSKVKVTGALNVKMVSADYLESVRHKVFIFHILIGHN